MLDELKRFSEQTLKNDAAGGFAKAQAKITIAAIEAAQRYKKDENGLLPCPFCGCVPNTYEDTVDAVGVMAENGGHYIGTCSTKCRIRFGGYFTTKEEAIKAWNTRADNAAVRAVLEVTGGGE